MGVCQDLIAKLSGFNLLFQGSMKLVKLDCKVSGLGGIEVLFGVNHQVRVVALIDKEGEMLVVALGALLYANSASGSNLDQLSC
jgi:hypothetical protein